MNNKTRRPVVVDPTSSAAATAYDNKPHGRSVSVAQSTSTDRPQVVSERRRSVFSRFLGEPSRALSEDSNTSGEQIDIWGSSPRAQRPLSTSELVTTRKSSIPGVLGGVSNSIGLSTASYYKAMVKIMHVVVCGMKKVGKTCILQQLALMNDITNQPYSPTMDDTYTVQMDRGDKPKEVIVLHDTAGVPLDKAELRRPYLQAADAFIFVYDVANLESFNTIDYLKKFIDKQFVKERKEVPMLCLGNVRANSDRVVEVEFALSWAHRERVKLYEVNGADRDTLLEPIMYLSSRFFHPQKESRFSLTKKLKPEKPGAAILMDI